MRFPKAPAWSTLVTALTALSACGDGNGPSESSQALVYQEWTPAIDTGGLVRIKAGHIVRVMADGTGRTVLWEGTSGFGPPHVAPDRRILFRAGLGWLLLPAGEGQTAAPFTPPDTAATDPKWAPDGGDIILWRVPSPSGDYALGTALTDGPAIRITPDSLEALAADWSPDGTRIAFSARNAGTGLSHLYTVARNGSDLRKITPDSLSITTAPSWSHAGDRIAFLYGDVFTVAPDGTGLDNVTRIGTGEASAFTGGVYWSPDDREMLSTETSSARLFRIKVDDGSMNNLHVMTWKMSTPWSPDGDRIAYFEYTQPDSRGQRASVVVARVDGSEGIVVSIDSMAGYSPVWLPSE